MTCFKTHGRCVMCNKYLACLWRTYKYTCSIECQRLLVNGKVKGIILNEKCIVCDKYFLPKKPGYIYCSTKCESIKNPNYNSIFSIFKRDQFRCIYCGKSSIEDGVKLAVDHIIAIGIGGVSEINNLVTCCKYCNSGKNITALSDEIRLRIVSILIERNNSLSPEDLELVNLEVTKFAINDSGRIMRLTFKRRNDILKRASV